MYILLFSVLIRPLRVVLKNIPNIIIYTKHKIFSIILMNYKQGTRGETCLSANQTIAGQHLL